MGRRRKDNGLDIKKAMHRYMDIEMKISELTSEKEELRQFLLAEVKVHGNQEECGWKFELSSKTTYEYSQDIKDKMILMKAAMDVEKSNGTAKKVEEKTLKVSKPKK